MPDPSSRHDHHVRRRACKRTIMSSSRSHDRAYHTTMQLYMTGAPGRSLDYPILGSSTSRWSITIPDGHLRQVPKVHGEVLQQCAPDDELPSTAAFPW